MLGNRDLAAGYTLRKITGKMLYSFKGYRKYSYNCHRAPLINAQCRSISIKIALLIPMPIYAYKCRSILWSALIRKDWSLEAFLISHDFDRHWALIERVLFSMIREWTANINQNLARHFTLFYKTRRMVRVIKDSNCT